MLQVPSHVCDAPDPNKSYAGNGRSHSVDISYANLSFLYSKWHGKKPHHSVHYANKKLPDFDHVLPTCEHLEANEDGASVMVVIHAYSSFKLLPCRD
ncbi:UNVERIFIED_CONTAM: hypothetical protein K2H54_039121 [Gekko kuhli]